MKAMKIMEKKKYKNSSETEAPLIIISLFITILLDTLRKYLHQLHYLHSC
jgi:hypothetical protein